MSSEQNSQNTPSYFTDQQSYTTITIIAITVILFLRRNCYVSTSSVYVDLSDITSKFRTVAMFVITGLKIAFHA
jgi:hypothetical protein